MHLWFLFMRLASVHCVCVKMKEGSKSKRTQLLCHLFHFASLGTEVSPPLLVQLLQIEKESCGGEGTCVSMMVTKYNTWNSGGTVIH